MDHAREQEQTDGVRRAGPVGRDDDRTEVYDVLVLGGGAAGLSGALTLGRARRRVLVVDDGTPRNRPAAHMHGFLGHDGLPPAELLRRGREEVARYGVEVIDAGVAAVRRDGGRFAAVLGDGREVRGRRVLLATGLRDGLPPVPDLAERWGRDVLHCPYCHGWEVRDQAVVVLGAGPAGPHQALLWRQWTEDITLVLHAGEDPTEEEWEQLAARGVRVVDGTVAGLRVEDDVLTGVRLESGRVLPAGAVVVATRMDARHDLLAGLGLEAAELTVGRRVVGTHLSVDADGRTAVPGVWAAGNVADLRAQVVGAAAGGVVAAAALNADLTAEDTRAAVERRRAEDAAPFSARAERELADRLAGDGRHGMTPSLAPWAP